jgi:hypothetical protein
MIFLFQPWTQYRWAVLRGTASAYESFARRYPGSDFADAARKRSRILGEDPMWQAAAHSADITTVRNYLRVYPNGKYVAEAERLCTELADQQWDSLAESRSEAAIRQFMKDYPETTHAADAKSRLQHLYGDFAWVQEQNTAEAYRQYLDQNPTAPNRVAIERKIVDLEVAAIAAGDHGELPKAQPLGSGGMSSAAEVSVENQTTYALTVRYSGPDSQKIVIPAGGQQSVTLAVGTYKVAATVSAFNVRNYVGTESMSGGRYACRFYVQTSLTPSVPTSPQSPYQAPFQNVFQSPF